MITRREALAAGAALLASALPRHPLQAAQGCGCFCRDGRMRLCDGRWLSYRESGHPEGPLVFYFHGIPGSRIEAALCADESQQAGVHLVSIDRPGMGSSTYQACRRILDWPGDVEQLAAHFGYVDAPFGIIGMSGGAPYAAACAVRMPHRLSHVAIVSGHAPMNAPGTCPGNQDKMIELVARRPRLAKMGFRLIDRRLDRRPDKVVAVLTKKWTAADRQLIQCDRQLYRQLVQNLNESVRCGPDGLVTDIRLLACPWGFPLCQIQGVPVSLWQGGCDPIVTPSMGHYLHRQIAGSELTLDPRAGHVTMLKWHIPEILSRFTS
jgi:pimeloyl-ACP methyl ester carboxylesterase